MSSPCSWRKPGCSPLAGTIAGACLCYGLVAIGRPLIAQRFGIDLPVKPPAMREMQILVAVIGASLLVGTLPALRAYRNTLSDGLETRT